MIASSRLTVPITPDQADGGGAPGLGLSEVAPAEKSVAILFGLERSIR